jgi:isopropylmalate/homocitrate/citramalate synthase
LYSPNVKMTKSRKMRWAGHVARMGMNRSEYQVFVGKLEGKATRKISA